MTQSSAARAAATPIVFLHVPKTAGQTIHHALTHAVGGPTHVSPVRVHKHGMNFEDQFPPGFRLYSGHIDWLGVGNVQPHPFVFTVLRDPRERIASFYFFLLKEAREMDPMVRMRPDQLGKRQIFELSADDYFTGGDARWQSFVRNYYDNFYCTYFSTRLMRGYGKAHKMTEATLLEAAETGLKAIDRVYHTDNLAALEKDIADRYGADIRVAGNYQNAAPLQRSVSRWQRLMDMLERDASRARLEEFAVRDLRLMERAPFV